MAEDNATLSSKALLAVEVLKARITSECRRILKEEAVNNTVLTGDWTDKTKKKFNPPLPPTLSIRSDLLPPKRTFGVVDRKRKRKDVEKETNAALRRMQKALVITPPVTQQKLFKLMDNFEVPREVYVGYAIDQLWRKYMSKAFGVFVDKTYPKHFFNTRPPYKPSDRSSAVWEANFKGLMRTSIDDSGNFVRRPTEKLVAIISQCSAVINGAYASLEAPPSETVAATKEEAFVSRVKRYCGFAELVNNISSDTRLNASALIFYYFRKVSPETPFGLIEDTLANIHRGSPDIEEVLITEHLSEGMKWILTAPDKDGEVPEVSKIVEDPYNIVILRGHPYSDIRGALKCEYLLLKLLFWLSTSVDPTNKDLREYVRSVYSVEYVGKKRDDGRVAMNNVLQIFPGLLTLMFYLLVEKPRDRQGTAFVKDLNHALILLSTMKSAGGRHAAIERHKSVSGLVMKVAQRCVDLISTGTIKYGDHIKKYATEKFLRSGFY